MYAELDSDNDRGLEALVTNDQTQLYECTKVLMVHLKTNKWKVLIVDL